MRHACDAREKRGFKMPLSAKSIGVLTALESELGRAASMRPPALPNLATLQRRFDRLTARCLAADSYCVFTTRQISIIGEEMVKYGRSKRAA